MYEDESTWISQTLLTFKDQKYATDGVLRLSISTSTKDFKQFNSPNFGISISNQYHRSYNLDIIRAKDLLESFKYAFSNTESLFNDKSQIVKQHYTLQFIMEFTGATDGEKVVKLMIKGGETDQTVVIVPVEIFQTFANALKYFVDKYYDICMRQYDNAMSGHLTSILEQLPALIKSMPSQILPANYTDSSAPVEKEVVQRTEATQEELDQFLGGTDMKNVEVAELKEEKVAPIVEVDSPFVKKFIMGDLRNLETTLNNTYSIEEIGDKMRSYMQVKEEISMLPGVTDEEMKSLLYISSILGKTIELSWTKFETPIPSSIPILKYKAKDNVQPENIELAYDLLVFSGYVRTLRRRLEDKISDANENKSLFHLKFRSFLDPFCYSFLEKCDKTQLSSIILSRYKYFNSIGVFDEYKNTLQMHTCSDITDQDILSYVNEVTEKVIGKSLYILDLHDNVQRSNKLRIGANSNFTKEQIINEIVPLEIAETLGQDTSGIEVSNEITQFFKGKQTKTKVAQKEVQKSKDHLTRVVGTLINDVPEKYREEFLEWIKQFDKKNFVFDDKFPYQEFGDDIIKALYVWKPENDARIGTSLKYYRTRIEDEVMEKQFILAVDEPVKKEEAQVDFSSIDWE